MSEDFLDTNLLIAWNFPGDGFHQKAVTVITPLTGPCTSNVVMLEFDAVSHKLSRLGLELAASVLRFKTAGAGSEAYTKAKADLVAFRPDDRSRVATIEERWGPDLQALANDELTFAELQKLMKQEIRNFVTIFKQRGPCAIHKVSEGQLAALSHVGVKLAAIINRNPNDVKVLLSAVALQRSSIPTLVRFRTFDRADFHKTAALTTVTHPIQIVVHT